MEGRGLRKRTRNRGGKMGRGKPAPPLDHGKLDLGGLSDDELSLDLSSSNEGTQSELEGASPSDEETIDEKRIRLAKSYLKTVREEFGAQDGDEPDGVDQQISSDALRQSGGARKFVAEGLLSHQSVDGVWSRGGSSFHRGHKKTPTCVAVHEDQWAFTGSKDCCVIQWDVETGKRLTVYKGKRELHERRKKAGGRWKVDRGEVVVDKEVGGGHTDEVLCVDVSDDGRHVVSGGKDCIVRVWDTRTGTLLENFQGHKEQLPCLKLRPGSKQLFTGSEDRTVKIWNLDEMAYIDSLFGHQSAVSGMDSFGKERCVTVGRDGTCRLWKVPEQTQLVFRAPSAGLDAVAMLTEDDFLSGTDDGMLCLWNVRKKKPAATIRSAHGHQDQPHQGTPAPSASTTTTSTGFSDQSSEQVAATSFLKQFGIGRDGASAPPQPAPSVSAATSATNPRWISSVAALRGSDLAASGSCDGCVRLWHCRPGPRYGLSQVAVVPVDGWVNGLSFARSGRFLACAVGQEHRRGRWFRDGSAKNGLCIIPLNNT